jgi:hypothetical protein
MLLFVNDEAENTVADADPLLTDHGNLAALKA